MYFLLSISGSWKAISLEKIRRLLLCTESVERLESRSSQCLFGGFRVFSTWDYAFLIGQSEFSTLRPVPGLLIDKPWVRGWRRPVFQNWGAILPWKAYEEIELEGIGTCARIEISQDADNADQKLKRFLKVHKAYTLLWEAYFQFSFFPSFYSRSHFTNFSIFTSLKMRVKVTDS